MRSSQIGAILIRLLLKTLALDLASVAVGTMELSGANVAWGVVLLSLDPVEDALVDEVDNTVEDGEMGGVEEKLESLDLEDMLRVYGCMPPMSIALEFVLVPRETLELICEAGDDDDEYLFGDARPVVVKCILVLLVRTVLFWNEDPKALRDPVPKRAAVMTDEGEEYVDIPAALLGKFLMDRPSRPPVVSQERFDESIG